MDTVFIGIIILAGLALVGYIAYDLFLKKNPNEVSNLEKKYIDPVLLKAQQDARAAADKAEADAAAAKADAAKVVKKL